MNDFDKNTFDLEAHFQHFLAMTGFPKNAPDKVVNTLRVAFITGSFTSLHLLDTACKLPTAKANEKINLLRNQHHEFFKNELGKMIKNSMN